MGMPRFDILPTTESIQSIRTAFFDWLPSVIRPKRVNLTDLKGQLDDILSVRMLWGGHRMCVPVARGGDNGVSLMDLTCISLHISLSERP